MQKVKGYFSRFKKALVALAAIIIAVFAAIFGVFNGPTVNPPTPSIAGYDSYDVQLQGQYATYNVTIFYNTGSGRYPLIVFCPGSPTYKTQYYNFCGRMANEGYIVGIPELYPFNGNITHEADALKTIVSYAYSDTFPLKNKFHTGKVCAMGHSHGGDGIYQAGIIDGRISILIPIATVQHELGDDVWQPALLIAGELDTTCPPERTIYVYNAMKVEKEYFVVNDADHKLGVWQPSGEVNMTQQNTVVKYTKAWLNWFYYGDVNGPLDFFNNQNDGSNIATDPMISSWGSSFFMICNYELGTPYSGSMGPGWNTPYHGRPGYPASRAELQNVTSKVFNGRQSANVTFEWDWAGASISGWPSPSTVFIGTMFMFAWLPGDYVGSMLYTSTGSITITKNADGTWQLSGPAGISVNLNSLGLQPVAGEWIPIEIGWIDPIDKVRVWWKNVLVGEGTWTGTSVGTFYMGYSHYTEQHQYWYSEYWDRTIVSYTFINYTFATRDYTELVQGWNTVQPWSTDVGKTLGEINASLTFDGISWTVIVLEYTNGTRYPFVYGYTIYATVTVSSINDKLYIYCTAGGYWRHIYP